MDQAVNVKRKHKKREAGDIVFQIVNYTIFTLFALICIYPFYYIFINTISDNNLVALGQIVLYPKGLNVLNYVDVFKLEHLGSSAINSVLRTVLTTGLSLICTSYLAYFFTKENMWKRKLWYRLVVATMYFNAGMIPVYLNMRLLGLHNNFLVYVIPGLISVYNMVLVKTFIESLPAGLEESAAIDGAGYMTRFFRIVLPLCTPILATVGLFTAVGQWNSYMDCLLYITDPNLYTLQYILQMYFRMANQMAQQLEMGGDSAFQASPKAIQLTITMVITLPILFVYPFVQRYFVKGIMVGAIKG